MAILTDHFVLDSFVSPSWTTLYLMIVVPSVELEYFIIPAFFFQIVFSLWIMTHFHVFCFKWYNCDILWDFFFANTWHFRIYFIETYFHELWTVFEITYKSDFKHIISDYNNTFIIMFTDGIIQCKTNEKIFRPT